eukprot:4040075-Amphidinium_carterae.1
MRCGSLLKPQCLSLLLDGNKADLNNGAEQDLIHLTLHCLSTVSGHLACICVQLDRYATLALCPATTRQTQASPKFKLLITQLFKAT